MNPVNDKWLRIIGISMLMALYVLSYRLYEQPLTAFNGLKILLTLGIFIGFWQSQRAIIVYFRRVYPLRKQLAGRLLLTVAAGIVAASMLSWLSGALRYLFKYGNLVAYHNADKAASFTLNNFTVSLQLFGVDVFQSLMIVGFYVVIYETLFFVEHSARNQKRLRQAEQEQEKLRTENLQTQLDALKQQVNPHFLFNSLNALDSLIEEDPKQARVFLDELSTVYRYLLRSNRESNLASLSSELDFIQSYYHLLKTRHGNGLEMRLHIDERLENYQLPPLTLQLLVENAVKHNIVLVDQPLQIQIRTTPALQLEVRNNVQRKTVRVLSNGVGLSNILAKYQMLNQPVPTVQEEGGYFVVTIPLIQSE